MSVEGKTKESTKRDSYYLELFPKSNPAVFDRQCLQVYRSAWAI